MQRETFEQWIKRVDETIAAKVGGFTHAELPDWDYRAAYDQHITPKEAARQAIKAAKEF